MLVVSGACGSHAECILQARSMTDKAKIAAAGAMNNVRTAIDSAKRIGFNGNTVRLCATDHTCLQQLFGMH